MKSPQIDFANKSWAKDGDNPSDYSEMKVLQSAAGYYIGTIYTDPDDGFEEPGSRDSDYFDTREEAEKYLEELEKGEHLSELRIMPTGC